MKRLDRSNTFINERIQELDMLFNVFTVCEIKELLREHLKKELETSHSQEYTEFVKSEMCDI